MRNLKKLLYYRQQVERTLTELRLRPIKPIDSVLRDTTKRSYSAFVKNQENKKCFIKIRLSESKQQRQFFYQSYWLGRVLNKHKPELYRLTPRLLNSQLGKSTDYLLYEFAEGKNMGSRTNHDVFKFKKDDLSNIINIHRSIKELSPHWFPTDFQRRGAEFYRFLILEDAGFDERMLSLAYEQWEIRLLKSIIQDERLNDTINRYTDTFQHGDFQAPNFLQLTNGKLIILDFDQCSFTNRFYDACHLYTHAFRKPSLQKYLLQKMISLDKTNTEEMLVYYVSRLSPSFVWTKNYLNKLKADKKNLLNRPDYPYRKQGYDFRVKEVKNLLIALSSNLRKLQL